MSYTTLRFDTDGSAADAWSDALLAAGALSVDLTDPFEGTPAEQAQFAEPGEPEAMAWPVSRLCALFAENTDVASVLQRLSQAMGQPVPPHTTWQVEEQDWVRATQAQFGPIHIGERLVIVPTWCKHEGSAIAITLDPGLAFGTGSHPTTRLCIEWLIDHLAGDERVLDYGCGSGILAIAAAKLGAGRVVGVDVDEQALRASSANARLNAVAATFVAPDDLPAGAVDIVVANILANPLILLAPALAARVRPGGRIALSGILKAQAEAVVDAYAPWFRAQVWREHEGWVLVEGVRCA